MTVTEPTARVSEPAGEQGPEPAFRGEAPGTPEAAWADPRWTDLPRPSWLTHGYDRAVVLAAHPDDETLGAGGLVASLAAAGLDVRVVVATAGEASHPDSPTVAADQLARLRRTELCGAMAALGVTGAVRCLDLPDGGLADHAGALEAAVADLVPEEQRTLLLAPWTADRHPDHEAVGRAARSVARRSGATLLQYPVWLWHWGVPGDVPWDLTVRFDVPHEIGERKARAVAAYRSQVAALSELPGDEPVLLPEMLDHFARDFEVFFLDDPDHRGPVEFDALHRRDRDPWGVDTRWYERRKRALTLAVLPEERYQRGLEIGCSVGALTADLADRCDHLTAVDASSEALAIAADRLRERTARGEVALARHHVPQEWPEDGDVDLVVMSEIGYFLSPRGLARTIERCLGALRPGGVLLACHWRGDVVGWPLTGDMVHDALLATDGLRCESEHEEADLVLHVFRAGGSAGVR